MAIISSDLQGKMNNSLRIQGVSASQIVGRSQFTSSNGAQEFSPDGTGVIEFTLSPTSFIDMASVRFEGILTHTPGIRLARSIQSVIQRLEIFAPVTGEHVADIDQFNVLQSALTDVTFNQNDLLDGSLTNTQLYGPDSVRDKYASGISFSMQINHSAFQLNSYFPAFLSGGVKVRLTLARKESAFIQIDNSLTNYEYKLSSTSVSYDVVSVTPVVQQQYWNAFNNNQLTFRMPTWRVSNYTSASQIDNIRVTNAGNSNRALMMVPRLVSDVNNPKVDSLGRRTAGSLRQLSVKVGDAVSRVHNTTYGAASLVALLQQACDFTSASMCINAGNFHSALPFTAGSQEDLDRSSKFLLLQSLELDQTDPGVLSGIAKTDISISLDYASQPSSDILYSTFLLVDQIATLGKDVGFKVLS